MDGSIRESGTSIVRRICTSISRITSINFLKKYLFLHTYFLFLRSFKSKKIIFSIRQFLRNSMKITQNLRMQNKIKWKNYFKIQTSSFSVKHLQTRNIAIRFLPPRDGEDETDLYAQRISRRIVCKRKKKKKGKSRAREGTRSCYRTFPRPTFSSARRKPRALSSFLDS